MFNYVLENLNEQFKEDDVATLSNIIEELMIEQDDVRNKLVRAERDARLQAEEDALDTPELRAECLKKYNTEKYTCFYRDTKNSNFEKIETTRFTAPLYKYKLVLNTDATLLQALEYLKNTGITSCGIKDETKRNLFRRPQEFLHHYQEHHIYSFAGDQKYIAKYFKFTGPKLTFANGNYGSSKKTTKDNYVGN